MNRGKFTNELHKKCEEYSNKQMIKHNMIWENYGRSCTGLFTKPILKKFYELREIRNFVSFWSNFLNKSVAPIKWI